MSEAKKWVKHTPRETPESKRGRSRNAPKVVMPPIPEDVIDALRLKYSVPTAGSASDIDGRYLEIWHLTCEIKGYLTKSAASKDSIGMHAVYWPDLRKILDQAIAENDPTVFAMFAKTWENAEIRNTARKKTVNTGKAVNSLEARLAASIENLIPNLPTNPANSPQSIQILNIIERLQGSLDRAPTQAEIVDDSGKMKDGGINKQGVSRQIGVMGLQGFLSQH